MKKGIHPDNYRLVAFKDMSNNDVFITKSAVETKDSILIIDKKHTANMQTIVKEIEKK